MAHKISVIVCTYNRLDYLQKCLAALLDLKFSDYEIVVVNDGSTDSTKKFLDQLADSRVRAIHHPRNLGLSMSRNTGIQNAEHDIIAFTDDDCIVDKDWLVEIALAFSRDEIGFVIGQTFYISKDYHGYFPERLVANREAKWPMGCNIAYRKKVFTTCGSFDSLFYQYNNEDSEMAIRAISHGFTYTRALTAIVYHQAATWTVRALLKSAKNASVWPLLKKKYPDHYQHFKPPIKLGTFINPYDYIHIITAPIFIPLLLIRYLLHGKKDLKIFFVKWPVYLLLRRFYVYREAIRNKILML